MTESDNSTGINLKDLLDIPSLQAMFDSFFVLQGIPTALLNVEGDILIRSGWKSICTNFHRVNPETAARCKESDTALARRLAEGREYSVYTCKNGLTDVATPLRIDGLHIGNLFTGQFFLEQPDMDYFEKQADRFGFDKAAYLAAVEEVSVVDNDTIEKAMAFLTDLTVIIAASAKDKKRLIEYSRNLEQRIKEKTHDLQLEIETRKGVERALRDSKFFLESVFDAIQDGIVVLDRELNLVEFNQTLYAWYPELRQRLKTQKKCYELFHDASSPCEGCPAVLTLKSGQTEKRELLFGSVDCQNGIYEVFSFPLVKSGGEKAVVEYMRDITERKKAEQLIVAEKRFSDGLINSLPGVMYVFNQAGILKRWNRNLETVSGYGSELIRKMHPLDFIAYSDRERVKEIIEKVFSEGSSQIEAGFLTIYQQSIPFLFTGYRFVQSEIPYLIGVGLDISDRVKTETENMVLIDRLQETLAHVKQLGGLLPICSSCKKIRDDAGYWQQLEVYFKDNSDVDFSHSLCPECIETLYPEFDIS